MATVGERVKTVVADKLGVDETEVTSTASFTEDLNADSLDLVELIMAFEEEFSTDEDAESITNVQMAIDFLKSKGVADS